jgi:hypothetical protein
MKATRSRFDESCDHIMAVLLELNYVRKAPGCFSSIARGLRVIEPASLMDLLDDALDEHRLTWDELGEVRLADIVLAGQLRTDGRDIYLLVEVSEKIERTDVARAAERSAFLEKLGRPVVPIVAGTHISEEAADLAARQGVWYAIGGRVVPPQRT